MLGRTGAAVGLEIHDPDLVAGKSAADRQEILFPRDPEWFGLRVTPHRGERREMAWRVTSAYRW